MVAPLGGVYQAGTLSGNPIAMAAGIETLRLLQRPGVYQRLEKRAAELEQGLKDAFEAGERPVHINRVGSLMTAFFTSQKVEDFDSARTSDRELFARYFHHMLGHGVYLPPSQFEAMFISMAHSEEDIKATVRAAKKSLTGL